MYGVPAGGGRPGPGMFPPRRDPGPGAPPRKEAGGAVRGGVTLARAPPLRRGGASFPCPAPAGGGSQSRGTVRWPRDRLLSRARARAQARRAEAWRRRWRCWAGPRPSSAARSGSSGDGGTRTGLTGDRWGWRGGGCSFSVGWGVRAPWRVRRAPREALRRGGR